MRKLTMAALISVSALSAATTAAFANPEMERCNGGPPFGAEQHLMASEPHAQSVPGVLLDCQTASYQTTYRERDSSRSGIMDRMLHRDVRGYSGSAADSTSGAPLGAEERSTATAPNPQDVPR